MERWREDVLAARERRQLQTGCSLLARPPGREGERKRTVAARSPTSVQVCVSRRADVQAGVSARGKGSDAMGRLSAHKLSAGASRPIFKVHYHKLVDEGDCGVDESPRPGLLSYCCRQCGHTQTIKAEELNSIVGNAFRMAYAAQLQRQPSFHDVIATQLHDKAPGGENNNCAADARINWTKQVTLGMNVQLPGGGGRDPPRLGVKAPPPSSIPGLRPPGAAPASQASTPSSDESNSPTELNSYKRLADKPPLVKRIAVGPAGGGEEGCPLVAAPGPRPLSGGYVNEAVPEAADPARGSKAPAADALVPSKHIEIDNSRLCQSSPASTDQDFKAKRISQISSSSSGSCPPATDGSTPTPPPLPERTDSLNNRAEEGELRSAPWFQAGIPREITLEVLSQEPVGAFMVRESTSKPGCYALSLRVPRDFQPSGIAHYLIMRTNKGYKIKGFTKEFSTLTALITHHSVMPELLPCPLSLSRYNPSFAKSDSSRDFADIDSDPDYNTLADFRKMMADLDV
ncbi:EGFR adapter protein-like [Bacillus rossius redtenbacheri]|uniref:EGFR adapter protein-like n=1 Tax=Bacillus rossius redtenbacheri TaxID=93214 RepID=UPI002FDCBF38